MNNEWYNQVKKMPVEKQWKVLYNNKLKTRKPGNSIWANGDYAHNSARLIELLPGILKDLNIKSFLDIGCGDFIWLSKLDWSEIDYTGIDIVPMLFEENKKNYPGMKFEYGNLIKDKCPKVDMVFMRSVLIHTMLDDCEKIIRNIKESGSTYLMASTSPETEVNVESVCLWLKKRNLEINPFKFPEPIYLVPEMKRDDGRNNYMGVWKINDLN